MPVAICQRRRWFPDPSMDLRKTVALGEQIQDATRVGHEAFVAERLRVGGHRMLVSKNQDRQALVIRIERSDDRLARARKRQTMDIEARGLRRIAGQQALDRCAIRADETLTRIFRIGETRFQQQ